MTTRQCTIWVGFDEREADAFAVAKESIRRRLSIRLPVMGLLLTDLQRRGLYKRPIEWRPSAADRPVMWDVVSDAPMSTQHAIARFFIPHLTARGGWALFTDGDVLVRSNLCRLFDHLDDSKALYCVQHQYQPAPGSKMDGQIQTAYARKNWSSVMALNLDHPANRALTLDVLNNTPGRDLHRFMWLEDRQIGALDPEWNHLVGAQEHCEDAKVAHFTLGTPSMPGFETQPFADEWRRERDDWARGALSFGD